MKTSNLIKANHTEKELAVLFGFDSHISNNPNDVDVKISGDNIIFHISGYELAEIDIEDYKMTMSDIEQ